MPSSMNLGRRDSAPRRPVHFNFGGNNNANQGSHSYSTGNYDNSRSNVMQYKGNYVQTARYTFYNFFFINLFEQFSRVANLYFLLIAVLQLTPGLSPTHWFTTVAPLLFVLAVNAIKEIYDDYYRHKSDDEVNNRIVKVLDGLGGIVKSAWKDLKVGDIVQVEQDQEIPADLVFLSSPDNKGICYVETANLDGETNLKIKTCHQKTSHAQNAIELKGLLQGKHVQCEVPNEKLYQFEGYIIDHDGRRDCLDASNLLLRGSSLRKPGWIIGLIVFAGDETKVQMNQSTGKRKVTQLERYMNILVIIVFIIQVILSVLGAIGREIWLRYHEADYYLQTVNEWPELGTGIAGSLTAILRFIILLNQLIPISLYVTLEVVKVAQCLFLNWDREMYHPESDTPFACRTTTLNEDLGQVAYVLSDKTGTLTQNLMGFVWASIGGVLYGMNPEIPIARDGLPYIPPNTPHAIAYDRAIRRIVRCGPGSVAATQNEKNTVNDFLLNLAICNTVVPTIGNDGDIVYQAESPDEEALVQGAAYLGYRLISRTNDKIEVEVHKQTFTFDVLATLEFNSERKRMSIICRKPDGVIRLYCKGADTVILQRLSKSQPYPLSCTNEHLDNMAAQGFRTLAISQKDIPFDIFSQWYEKYHAATVSLTNREEKISKMADLIESELVLIGATAVEDKLQEGVPDAIDSLSEAGIKVWVLTGDKLETAVTISYSCALFNTGMKLVYLKEGEFMSSSSKPAKLLANKSKEIDNINNNHKEKSLVGLVVEGGVLSFALKNEYQDTFLEMCQKCRAVVCCRVSPMQKAQVTNLVKKKAKAITLAIGDGANDVGMIQAAHIGVGISGREGRAAVLASDFSMAQFKFLKRLLLVHGRWSYKRNSEVVLYAFYKNFAYCLANVYLNFIYAGFSSQPIYASALIATYNLFWTSLPTVAFAILEQDVLDSTVLAAPQLYRETMLQNKKSFFNSLARWVVEGIWHSFVTFFIPLNALQAASPNGKMLGIEEVGAAIYTAVIITVNLKVAIRTQHWTIFNFIFVFIISIGMWFPFVYVCSFLWQWYGILSDSSGVAMKLFKSPAFWITSVLGAPLISLTLDTSILAFENRFWPHDNRIFQECEKTGKFPKSNVRIHEP